jgi:hypothetical protein
LVDEFLSNELIRYCNHSKYVPIGLEKLSDDHCERAFLNVLAVSDRIENAIVCCTDNSSIASPCPSESNFLPFANRLARWPDAWLFPLFPLLFRLLYTAFRGLENTYYSDKHNSAIISSFVSMTALRRLGYYVILLNFRGWVLYVGLNAIEDRIVQPVDNETCWYHEWLRVDQSRCFGRVFDFSDHIVLYYAQILPVALFEFLHTLEYPFWAYSRSMFKSTDHVAIVDRLCPILMCFGICYLYFITCLGVYKTSVYFHTGFEVVVGFLVSSIVQIPLCLIQCSDQMETMRDFLFATSHVKYKGLT